VLGLPLDNNGTGNARIFTHNRGSWDQHAIFWHLNGHFHKGEFSFGSTVAISGDTVAVGTKFKRSAGAVHIYIHAGGDWHQLTQMLGSKHRNFGSAVAISGSTMAIGAPGATSGNGAVYMYRRHGSRWAMEGRINPPGKGHSISFGHSIALSGGRLLIGADNQTERRCGAAYEYVSSGSSWVKKAVVINPGCSRNDEFGYSLGLSGQTAVIGAPGWHNSAGAAYVESIP
jgi:FG-GAP repeat